MLLIYEKPQSQVFYRTQAVLPMTYGLPAPRPRAYVRHGTTTLFATLEFATGKVTGKLMRRHRCDDFNSFMCQIGSVVRQHLDVHPILRGYSTQKTAKVGGWLLRYARFTLQFVPTHSYWPSQIERLFAAPTQRQLGRGTRRSSTELERAIRQCLGHVKEDAGPFYARTQRTKPSLP